MSNKLYHHGILGMKWGVRRFQREDGSRTPSGKKRRKETDYIRISEDAAEAARLSRKKSSELSNKELQALNQRRQLESTRAKLEPGAIKKGQKYVAAAIGVIGTVTTAVAAGDKIIEKGKKVIEKILPPGTVVIDKIN